MAEKGLSHSLSQTTWELEGVLFDHARWENLFSCLKIKINNNVGFEEIKITFVAKLFVAYLFSFIIFGDNKNHKMPTVT